LPAFLRDLLAAHIARFVDSDPDALVFTTLTETPLRSSNFRRIVWLPATRATGNEGLQLHDLRHTAASLLISERAHPRAVTEHLGHSSIRVTMDVYGHLFPSDMEDLAARLDARHRSVS
jgi:integrase